MKSLKIDFFHVEQVSNKFQFFLVLKKLIFRPSEGYSGMLRCEIRIQREKTVQTGPVKSKNQ